ncbi:MAG: O-antigen ligase family protein [Eubacteriales bacterium]|nr:O-antigen ligase family protein [Eubacteriales bacterium]
MNWKRIILDIRKNFNRDEQLVLVLIASAFISSYLAAAVAACILVDLLASRRLVEMIRSTPGWKYLLGFCALVVVVPLLWKRWEGAAGAAALCGFLLLSVFVRRVMSRRLLERALDVACALSVLCAFFALGQQIAMWSVPGFRPWATFDNANYYGSVTAFVSLVCLYRMLRKASVKERIYYFAVLLCNVMGLFLCECRTAMAALAVAVPVMLLVSRRYKALAFSLIGVAAMALLFVFSPAILPRSANLSLDMADRENIFRSALRGFLRSPVLGQGMLAYHQLGAGWGGPAKIHAHNLFLDCLLNFGVVGCGLLAAYFARMTQGVRALARDDRRLFALVCGIALVTVLHGMLDVTLLQVHTGILFMLIAAVPGMYEQPQEAQELAHSEQFSK